MATSPTSSCPPASRPVRGSPTRLLALALLALGIATLSPATRADDDPVGAARVNSTRGDVRLYRAEGETIDGSDGRWLRAQPVGAGDRLQTGWNARAEVAAGPDRLRLDEDTTLVVRRLDTRRIAITIERGRVALLIRHDETARLWQIDTAAGTHLPLGAGLFRIDTPPPHQAPTGANATAWRSPLRIDVDGGTLTLPPGRRVELDRFGQWQTGLPCRTTSPAGPCATRRDDGGAVAPVAPVAPPALSAAPVELPPRSGRCGQPGTTAALGTVGRVGLAVAADAAERLGAVSPGALGRASATAAGCGSTRRRGDAPPTATAAGSRGRPLGLAARAGGPLCRTDAAALGSAAPAG